ncbi:hypothetical protein LEP1GSC168_0624 [Leptospira santarosai str. HAI134]|nr:hypothetical protein LEP1GSC168_0624 [Leptospira santarosai str. HAI134]
MGTPTFCFYATMTYSENFLHRTRASYQNFDSFLLETNRFFQRYKFALLP